MLPAGVRSAVDRLYEAGFNKSLWQAGLAQLCDAIGADSAITVPRIAAEDTIVLPTPPNSPNLPSASSSMAGIATTTARSGAGP